jgi:oligoendopeptidase F
MRGTEQDMPPAHPERPGAAAVNDVPSLDVFITRLEDVLHHLGVRTALAWWAKYTGEAGEDIDLLERERSEIMLDPAYRALVEAWQDRVPEPMLARKLRVLRDAMRMAEVSSAPEVFTLQNEIMNRVVAYRPVVFGREVSNSERTRILRREPDRALRREAWMSIAPLSMEVASATVELIRRRNALARRAGHAGYVDLALVTSSLARDEMTAVIDGAETNSAGAWRVFLEEASFAEGLTSIEPWDMSYLVEKAVDIPTEPFGRDRILPALEAFVRSFGQDPEALGVKIVYHDIPYGGLCVPVDPPTDVRVLANPQDGHNYFHTLFHEFGHCLHALYAGENPYILQGEPGVFCEGMAEVWAWFVFHPEWLRGLGLEKALAERVARTHRLRMMATHRALAANVMWEYQAYDDPGQDLTALHAAMEARFLTCEPRPVHRWGGTPFPSGYPIYWQNYILSDLIAAATHRALAERFGPGGILGNPRVFEALAAAYWRPGASRPWREKLRELTGRDLDAAAFPYRG